MTQHTTACELDRVRELAQEIINALGPCGAISHLAPQARAVRNGLLKTLSEARSTLFQPPVVDLWALAAALIVVAEQLESQVGGVAK